MTLNAHSYLAWISFFGAGLLFTAALLVWTRNLFSMLKFLSAQGLMLVGLALVQWIRTGNETLLLVAILFFVLRVVVIPRAIKAVLAGKEKEREVVPIVNTTASLLLAAILILLSFLFGESLLRSVSEAQSLLIPLPLATFFIALLLMITRRNAISQLISFLCLDNAISGLALIATSGVPLIVEVGISLDVFFLVLVLTLTAGRMKEGVLGTDLGELKELHE